MIKISTYKKHFLTNLGFVLSAVALAQTPQTSRIDSIAKGLQNLNEEISLMKRLKISGYIQPQFQRIDSAGAPSFEGGDFVNGSNKYDSRFTMRRGRFKFTYNYNNVEVVVNTDITERGLFMRETYGKITDPWKKIFSITAGLLQCPFGHEVTYSSALREAPERARMFQLLIPAERDLGIFGTMEFPKQSKLRGLRMDVALMNGISGINPEIDSYKDFVGRLQYARTTDNKKVSFGAGVSYYNGGYRIGNLSDFYLQKQADGTYGYDYSRDTANYNRIAKRVYYGADLQLTLNWRIGTTALRAEYVQGEQPGTMGSSSSPKAVPTAKLYHRNFNGACFYFIQNIGKSKFQTVLKYDWYDPNTRLGGKDIGKIGTNTNNAGDIRFDTYGFGINYQFDKNIRLMLYYDYIMNENTLVTAYTGDIKDNVFTCRMQFKF